jgi:hypothetical protein
LGCEAHILDALRPSPDVQISLRGGIRLQDGQWLAGYPPAIRLYGDVQPAGPPAIDGAAAVQSPDGSFTADSWDSVGNHSISCAGQTKSYSIVDPEDGWDVWPAYAFSAGRGQKLPSICGALAASAGETSLLSAVALAPAGNPLLLGPQPGQIFRCPGRQDVRLPVSAASLPFEPVWALPADPLHADKRTAHVRLVGAAHAPQMTTGERRVPRGLEVVQWCAAILDCSRKGLGVEPASAEAVAAWKAYCGLARRIWRASR